MFANDHGLRLVAVSVLGTDAQVCKQVGQPHIHRTLRPQALLMLERPCHCSLLQEPQQGGRSLCRSECHLFLTLLLTVTQRYVSVGSFLSCSDPLFTWHHSCGTAYALIILNNSQDNSVVGVELYSIDLGRAQCA